MRKAPVWVPCQPYSRPCLRWGPGTLAGPASACRRLVSDVVGESPERVLPASTNQTRYGNEKPPHAKPVECGGENRPSEREYQPRDDEWQPHVVPTVQVIPSKASRRARTNRSGGQLPALLRLLRRLPTARRPLRVRAYWDARSLAMSSPLTGNTLWPSISWAAFTAFTVANRAFAAPSHEPHQ